MGDDHLWQMDFAPGDSEVVFFSINTVFRASLGGDSGPVRLMESEYFEKHPSLSPDGRWLAYISNGSGIDEVYVRSFPDMGPPTVIERSELFRAGSFRQELNRNYGVHPNGQEFVMVGRTKTRVVRRVNALAGER